jgi:hypothetical protein
MDVKALRELCQKLEQTAALQDIMEGDPINTALHREASQALQALFELERLQCELDLHRQTSDALRDAHLEIERLRSDAELHQPKVGSLPSSGAHTGTIDWITQFLERKQALTRHDLQRKERRR